jgi:hypothetical protein
MNTDPSSNVQRRTWKDETSMDDIPKNGDWSALEAKARKDMEASKKAIEKRRLDEDMD